MAEKKKTKLGDLGEQPSPDVLGKTSSKQVEVNKSKMDTSSLPAREGIQIGGYDLRGGSSTVTLGRAMQEQKTKEAGQALAEELTKAILERQRKRNQKP